MQLTGSEIVIECLKEQGVDTVFGYPGGAILNVYDELYKHQNEIKHILTSHEQGAAQFLLFMIFLHYYLYLAGRRELPTFIEEK